MRGWWLCSQKHRITTLLNRIGFEIQNAEQGIESQTLHYGESISNPCTLHLHVCHFRFYLRRRKVLLSSLLIHSLSLLFFSVNLIFPLSGYGKTHKIAFISSKSLIESLARSVTSFFYFNFNYCVIDRFSLLLINYYYYYYYFGINSCFSMKLGILIFVVYVIAYEFDLIFM